MCEGEPGSRHVFAAGTGSGSPVRVDA